MRFISLLFLLSSLTLVGAHESSFTADEIIVNEKTLSLSGNVVLNHPLGRIKLEGAEVTSESSRFDSGIQTVVFNYPASLLLQDGSSLSSPKGEINFLNKQGFFYSNRQKVQIHINASDIKLTCNELDFAWDNTPPFLISNMSARNSVKLSIEDVVFITADTAGFVRLDDSEDQSYGMFSIEGGDSNCILKSTNTTIQAPRISFDTNKKELCFISPSGTYNPNFSNTSDRQLVHFTADSSICNLDNQSLSLGSNANVSLVGLGSLSVNEGFSIQKHHTSELLSYTTIGKSHICHQNGIEILAETGTQFHESNSVVVAHGCSPIQVKKNSFIIQATDISFLLTQDSISELSFSNDVELKADDLIVSGSKILFDTVNDRIHLYPNLDGTINCSLKETILPIHVNHLVIERDLNNQEVVVRCIGRTHLVLETEQKNQIREMVTQCKTFLCSE